MATPPETQISNNLTVFEISHISPPQGSVPETPETCVPLTFFDITWLCVGPVNRIFFYSFPYSTSHFTENVLPVFKSSLSLSLKHFFPLAGKVRLSPSDQDRFEIHYVDGDSVKLTVAEHANPEEFRELSNYHPRNINKLLPLQPTASGGIGGPLMELKVTVFSCHGVAVGVSVHHAACDGSSSMQFISTWAKSCRTTATTEFDVESLPLIDRTLMSDPLGLHNFYFKLVREILSHKKLDDTSNDSVISTPEIVIATFTLTSQQIQGLKKLIVTSNEDSNSSASYQISTIVVTLAYVWVCLAKARGWPVDRIAHLAFAVDCRRLLRPPLPSTYFGNCIQSCFVEGIKTCDLVGKDGFVTAALAIAKGIKEMKNDALKGPENIFDKYVKLKPLTVAGSPRFRVYDVDFGWGRPIRVDLTSVMDTRAMALAESREDSRGIEIGLVMPKDEMDEFAIHFSGGLELLLS